MKIELEGQVEVNETVFLDHFTRYLIDICGVGLEDEPQQECGNAKESHQTNTSKHCDAGLPLVGHLTRGWSAS